MARVTIEDCIEEIPNRFELVVLASARAKNISSGAVLTVDRNNDKNPVIALREIATKSVSTDVLRELQITTLQKYNKIDEVAEENLCAESKEVIPGIGDYSYASDDVFSQEVDILVEEEI